MQVIADMQDRAGKRGGKDGKWTRRFIVVSVFSFITWLFWVTGVIGQIFNKEMITTYLTESEGRSYLFGLFTTPAHIKTIELSGIPMFDHMLNMGWLIVTFYFGSSRIK